VGMAGYVSTDGEDDIEEAARLSVSSRHLSTARSRVHGVFTHRSHPTPKRTSTATGGAIHPLQEVACVSRVSWSEGACEVGEGAVQDHDDCVKGMCALQAVSRTQSVHSVSPAPDEGCAAPLLRGGEERERDSHWVSSLCGTLADGCGGSLRGWTCWTGLVQSLDTGRKSKERG
jgi:hypothetical protein